MKEKLYICVLSVIKKEIGDTTVLTAAYICAATSKEEAIGKAIEYSKKIWPIKKHYYSHGVSAEEFSDWTINEVHRLYPAGEFYE